MTIRYKLANKSKLKPSKEVIISKENIEEMYKELKANKHADGFIYALDKCKK